MIIDVINHELSPITTLPEPNRELSEEDKEFLRKCKMKYPNAGLTKTVTIPHMCFGKGCRACLFMWWQDHRRDFGD